MSDVHSSVKGQRGEGESPCPHSADVGAACGWAGETPSADGITAFRGADEEMPPPPRPLPDAVTRVAAGLLVTPERAGPAGLPVVAGYELLAPLGRGGMGSSTRPGR
jgi:hypothetical protein